MSSSSGTGHTGLGRIGVVGGGLLGMTLALRLRQRGARVTLLDVNALVRDTVDLMRTNLLMRHVALVTTLAPDLPPLEGDRVQLQQMLLNLIINAADAMRLYDPADPSRSALIFSPRRKVSYDARVLEHLAPAEVLDAARRVSVSRPIILTTRKPKP